MDIKLNRVFLAEFRAFEMITRRSLFNVTHWLFVGLTSLLLYHPMHYERWEFWRLCIFDLKLHLRNKLHKSILLKIYIININFVEDLIILYDLPFFRSFLSNLWRLNINHLKQKETYQICMTSTLLKKV